MGSCISKCRPKKQNLQQQTTGQIIQDKLVISTTHQTNTIIPPPSSNKISPCPPSPTSSTSSFTCPNYTANTISSSSSSSSSSSNSSNSSSLLSSSKDRAFSNEFLWSCYKENPHVVRINSIKETSFLSSLPPKPIVCPNLQRVSGSNPQKRVRSSSPVLTRQKSFRKEPTERCNNVNVSSSYSIPNRTSLRSPSPSRRFVTSTDKSGALLTNTLKESVHSKRISSSNGFSSVSSYSNSSRKENMWAASPNNISSRSLRSCLRNRETCIHRISSKIDEIAVNQALAHNDHIDDVPMEDINNPLISLDCFIFL